MKVLITGATGSTGWFVAETPFDEGWEAIGLDNDLTSDRGSRIRAALEHCRAHHLDNLVIGNSVELLKVVESTEEEFGKRARVRNPWRETRGVPTALAGITRAREEFGYRPQVLISEEITGFPRRFREERREEKPC